MEELIELSKNISDSYPDFVIGVESAMKKNPKRIEELKNIIKDNSEITTSDVCEWIFVNIMHVNLENPKSIVVDDEDGEDET